MLRLSAHASVNHRATVVVPMITRRFVEWTRLFVAVATLAALPSFAADNDASRYDGTWWATLHCADTKDRQGLVKGYDFAFAVTVRGGALDGRYRSDDENSSLHWIGTVAPDGVVEIRADGRTGSTEYVVGRAAAGTAYHYTMAGRLDGDGGEATRREIRPCTARFVRRS